MKLSEMLRGAASFLTKDNWSKHIYYEDTRHGKYCAIGAISKCANIPKGGVDYMNFVNMEKSVDKLLGQRMCDFNDNDKTSFEDVISKLNELAVKAEQQGL